jgi:DNA repair protein RecN (Recombination protein N)
MLLELSIQDLAIIDDLTISIGPGLNVFTGETGAGKSIIIDAIDLVLGDRASSELIRSGKEEARVEALFNVPEGSTVARMLDEAGIPPGDNLIIKRIIQRSGRNKVYINNSLSTLVTLAEVGRHLIDICGQSEHQSLTRQEEHIDMLDLFGDMGELRKDMSESFRKWASLKRELDELKALSGRAGEDHDLLIFQSKEIADAGLKPGDDERLRKDWERLKNAERIAEATGNAERALYSNTGSVTEVVGALVKEIKEVSIYDKSLVKAGEKLESMLFETEELARALGSYGGSIEGDPAKLEELSASMDTLNKLKRKYGDSIEAILKKKTEIDEKLGDAVDYDDRLKQVEGLLEMATDEAGMLSDALTGARAENAKKLKKGIEKGLSELGMKGALFEARIETERIGEKEEGEGDARPPRFGEKGADRVNFMISTNPGEDLKPLAKVASGGELSRIMLAMKGLTAVGRVPTLIFDEVDTGVGGAMVEVIARKLMEASIGHQVFCITHMPQIAAFADNHHYVCKEKSKDGRTVTRVKKLSSGELVERIAVMLGGAKITDITRKHAEELLQSAGK